MLVQILSHHWVKWKNACLALELYLLLVIVWRVPLREPRLAPDVLVSCCSSVAQGEVLPGLLDGGVHTDGSGSR